MTEKMTTAEAAEYTGFSESYFRCGRYNGNPNQPAYIKIGRKVIYLRADLDDWLSQHRVEYKKAA